MSLDDRLRADLPGLAKRGVRLTASVTGMLVALLAWTAWVQGSDAALRVLPFYAGTEAFLLSLFWHKRRAIQLAERDGSREALYRFWRGHYDGVIHSMRITRVAAPACALISWIGILIGGAHGGLALATNGVITAVLLHGAYRAHRRLPQMRAFRAGLG